MTSSASNSDLPKTGLQLHIGTTLQQAIDSLRQYPWSTPLLLAFLSLAFLVYAYSFSSSATARRRKGSEKAAKSSTATSMADTSSTGTGDASAKSIPAPGQVRVSKLLIHPIKSCRGTSVQSANYTPEGLENDRIWCIIDAKAVRVLTAREISKMVLITPTIEENGTLKISFPEESGIAPVSVPIHPAEDVLKKWKVFSKTITLWPGVDVDGYVCEAVSGPRGQVSLALSKFLEKPVHLVLKGPIERKIVPTPSHPDLDSVTKFQDGYPLLVLSEESTASVDEYTQKHIGTQGIDERWKTDKVTIERFRPNIVFSGGGAFAEDDWEEISIGSAGAPTISLVSKCTRCLLPNVSPETGVRDNAVPFKVLMKFRTGIDPKHKLKPCVGCNAVPRASGTVKVGDVVYVKKMSSAP